MIGSLVYYYSCASVLIHATLLQKDWPELTLLDSIVVTVHILSLFNSGVFGNDHDNYFILKT